MKVLLDSCVWGRSIHVLEAAGHDVEWTGNWQRDPGDEEILAYAVRDSCILVRLDINSSASWPCTKLASLRNRAFGWILREATGRVSVLVLTRYGMELEARAIVTVELGR